ncbi:IWF1': Non-specific lipid-transfer protein [Bienertia sinuspersici]
MASSALVKLACAVILCVVVVAPHAEAAMNCGIVSSNVAQCISYLNGRMRAPSGPCCGGIKRLKSMASTPAARRVACGCLKSAAGTIKGIDFNKASGLPGRCGVSIPYAINPRTDCSRVN